MERNGKIIKNKHKINTLVWRINIHTRYNKKDFENVRKLSTGLRMKEGQNEQKKK